MKIGMVTKEIPLHTRADFLPDMHFVTVKVGLEEFTAADLVRAQTGDMVLLVTGQAACRCAMEAPVDAAVIGIL